ncbi:hypothetical protein DM860_016523 [Cuscuta australis]|uniref:Uncharacterized protein n=1 Tax=Cuscuta australis TaxID=267555 RepID=A0A328E281_9ASTE|nr:hypothetical protein DM860_016523 [Cuscuta australis]
MFFSTHQMSQSLPTKLSLRPLNQHLPPSKATTSTTTLRQRFLQIWQELHHSHQRGCGEIGVQEHEEGDGGEDKDGQEGVFLVIECLAHAPQSRGRIVQPHEAN